MLDISQQIFYNLSILLHDKIKLSFGIIQLAASSNLWKYTYVNHKP